MRLPVAKALIAGGLVAGSAALAQQFTTPADLGPTSAPKKPISFDLTSIDKTANPCNDFYQYACGNWIKNNPIPPSEVRWGSFNTLGERNQYLLWQELSAAAAAPRTPLQKKYGDYYAACMNTDLADKLGTRPLEPQLKTIAAFNDKKKLAQLDLTLSQKYGGGGLFGVGVGQDQKDSSQQILNTGQGGLALPDRDYYLSTEPRYIKIREQYVAHVTKMFELLGDTPEAAATEAASVMRIETALAQGSMDRVAMRDPAARYHIMTVAQVQELTPDFNWQMYLDGLGVGKAKTINVSAPGFTKTASQVIETEPISALQSYMRWHAVHREAANLSQPFVDENFAFFNQTLAGRRNSSLAGSAAPAPPTERWARRSDRTG